MMFDLMTAAQLFSTLSMVGLIWLIQIVQYPLMSKVGAQFFSEYHQAHMNRISFVVGPLMLTELVTASWWLLLPPAGCERLVQIAFALVILNWLSTAVLQVPLHQSLQKHYTDRAHRLLVQTNWLRTLAWTIRGILVIVIASKM